MSNDNIKSSVSQTKTYERYIQSDTNLTESDKEGMIHKFNSLSDSEKKTKLESIVRFSRSNAQHKKIESNSITTK